MASVGVSTWKVWMASAVLAGVCPVLAAAEPAEGVTELVVRWKPSVVGTQARLRAAMLREAGLPGGMAWREHGQGLASVRLPSRLSPQASAALQARWMSGGSVAWVQPVRWAHRHQAMVMPDDPFFQFTNLPAESAQWWLKPVSAIGDRSLRQRGVPDIQGAWSTSRGLNQGVGQGTVVAVLDAGVRTHVDLETSRLLPGHDFSSDFDVDGQPGRDADPTDPGDAVSSAQAAQARYRAVACGAHASTWHGLVIAGLVGAATDNGQGVAGVNWGARILPVRISGQCGASQLDIVDGMRWAAGLRVDGAPLNANPARVITVSFGSPGACDPLYQAAVSEVRARGALVVVSAGNDHGSVDAPANCQGAVAVAAMNREGFKSTYSNFGPQIAVSTVGGDPRGGSDSGRWAALLGDTGILTVTDPLAAPDSGGGYAYHFGTSFSAPLVASVASLMLDVNPALTVDQLVAGLQRSARPHVRSGFIGTCSAANPGRCRCDAATCGAGLLDAPEALRFAADPVAYRSPWPALGDDIDTPEVRQAVQTVSAQDRAEDPVSPSGSGSTGSGGGGGAIDPLTLGTLALIVAGLLWPRRRVSLRRA